MPTRLTDIARYEGSGETIAVGAGEWQVSYRDLDRRCDGIAAAFAALGYRPGERIVLLLPSIPDFAAGYLGAHRAGLVTVPVNPLVGEDEFGRILTAMAPRAIVGPMPGAAPFPAIQKLAALRDAYAPDALILYSGARGKEAEETAANALPFTEFHNDAGPAPSVVRDLDDEAAVFFTSGTSGKSKGVSVSERSLISHAATVAGHLSYSPDDVILTPLPFSHIFGQVSVLLAGLSAGARIEAVPRPAPDLVFEAMERVAPTHLLAVPTTIAALTKIAATDPDRARAAARRLRIAAAGGAAMAEPIAIEFIERFGAKVLQGYGMTETAGVISLPPLTEGFAQQVGPVVPAFDYRIDPVDPADPQRGELQLRGNLLLRGYYIDGGLEPHDPDAWFSTGDLVHVDDDGQLTIFDRKKEMILRGGYNVYPSEVEDVLSAHPAVSIAAVTAAPHAELGQEVAAFVLLKSDVEVTAQELIDWCRNRLSLYKYPRILKIVDELPLTPTGKVLKRALPVAELEREIS